MLAHTCTFASPAECACLLIALLCPPQDVLLDTCTVAPPVERAEYTCVVSVPAQCSDVCASAPPVQKALMH